MNCQLCNKRPAKVELKYLGKTICNSCFIRITEKRINKTLRLNKLIEKGDKVAVAVSGGKDSVLTLRVLADYCREKRVELVALYVDRGDKFSKKCSEMARKVAKEVGVKFYSLSFKKELGVSMADIINITKKVGAKRCSVCGVFRRRVLDKKARGLKCNKLATGHNLTDEAQSALMNFVKGELRNFSHFGAISPPSGFVRRIKPLREVPEEEARKYVELKKWGHVPQPCPCRVGSLRFNFMSYLDDIKKVRPGAEFAICKIGDELAKIKSKVKLKKCSRCGELTSREVCRVCEYLGLKI